MDVNPYVTSSKHEFHRQESYVNGQPVYEKRHERRYENGRLVHEDGHERGNPSSVHSGLNAGGYQQSSSSSSRRSSSSSSSHGQHLPVIHGEFYQGEGSAGAQRFSTRSGSSSSQNAYGSGAIVRPSYRSGYSPSQGRRESSRRVQTTMHRTETRPVSTVSTRDQLSGRQTFRNTGSHTGPTYRPIYSGQQSHNGVTANARRNLANTRVVTQHS